MDFDFDDDDPTDFFIWDQFIDPGKYQCENCGGLFDEEDDCIEWSEERQCHLFECPDCGATGRIQG